MNDTESSVASRLPPILNEKEYTKESKVESGKFKLYQDHIGVWTIGFGHTARIGENSELIQIGGKLVDMRNGITLQQARQLHKEDMKIYGKDVERLVKVKISENQKKALVSFAYSVGITNLRHSTLLKYINKKEFDKVPKELLRWSKADGKVDPTLKARREAEGELWLRK